MNALRQTLLASVSAVALTTGAYAADLAVKAPMAVKAPPLNAVEAWNWTGLYIGVNGGAAWNRADFDDLGDGAGNANISPAGTRFWSPNAAGGTIGGQIGYNFQSGNIVYGLEADLNWVDGSTSAIIGKPTFSTVAASTELSWFGTVRGRLGVTFSPTLIYVTGGAAAAHFKDVWSPTFANITEFSSDVTRTGWTVGGGIEHMMTRNWTIKVEGLYADFGNWTVNSPLLGQVGPYRSRFTHSVAVARGGLNWKW
jgi:outer membrane immunogenic protein